MEIQKILKEEYGLSDKVIELGKVAEENIRSTFDDINATAEYNQIKVLTAFSEHRVSEAHLGLSTGYGYDDLGRDTLERFMPLFSVQNRLWFVTV